MVLGFGEMLEEDQPDEKVWLDEPALLEHFDSRRAAHREKNGNSDEDDWDDWSKGGEIVQNELADELLREVIG